MINENNEIGLSRTTLHEKRQQKMMLYDDQDHDDKHNGFS